MSKHFNMDDDDQLVTVDNPTEEQLLRLEYMLSELELPRNHFDFGFVITSGLRPPKKKYSQHQDGYAADFVPLGNIDEVFDWMVKFCDYDQIILETKQLVVKGRTIVVRWIHFSRKKSSNRHEALTASITYVKGKEITKYLQYTHK